MQRFGLLKQWFCPAPWSVKHTEIDLRPGGIFKTIMVSPEGQEFPHMGCFLEVVPQEGLVFTDALTRIKHVEMGIHGGWSTALDQLLALIARG